MRTHAARPPALSKRSGSRDHLDHDRGAVGRMVPGASDTRRCRFAAGDAASTVFTGLAASEKAIVIGHNIWDLFAGPIALLTGYTSASTIALTVVGLGWCFIARRQTIPDLFLLLYAFVLIFLVAPPERAIAPVLPFVLWVVWRVLRRAGSAGAMVAIAAFVALAPLGPDMIRIARARAAGNLSSNTTPPNNWYEWQRLFAAVRGATGNADIALSNNDGVVAINTGRKTVRGFTASPWELFYSPSPRFSTPDQLSRASPSTATPTWVVLTPDAGLPESVIAPQERRSDRTWRHHRTGSSSGP